MEWNPSRLHHLRLRLGWSQSDLARRLECSSQELALFEEGQGILAPGLLQKLDFIENQARVANEDLFFESLADLYFEESSEEQIDHRSLLQNQKENE